MQKPIESLIEQYLEFRKLQGLSKDTLRLDRTALNKFAAYLKTARLEFTRITLADLQRYQNDLQESRTALTGVYKYLTVLRCFCRYCLNENLLLHNPAARLELPRKLESMPRHIPDAAQLQTLFAAPQLDTISGLRDRAILELAYSAGLRRNEIVRLNRADLDLDARQARVVGKGERERMVPFGKAAAHYLKLYLKASENFHPKGSALFQNQYGGRFGVASLAVKFIAYIRRLGLDFTFHGLRHACALHMLQNRAGIRHIQALLGHRCIETTQRYTRLLPQDLKRAHQQTHPREREALQRDESRMP